MADQVPNNSTNLDGYGFPALPWSRPRGLLATGSLGPAHPFFLGTISSDGRPHAAGIGVVWLEGDLYFPSGLAARKARNLAANPACTISTRLPGIDLILEGEARQVADRLILERVAAEYRAGGWPAEVAGDAFTAPYSAPSAGPPPWHLFRFVFHTALGVATAEPYGATRWRFDR